MSPKTHAYYTLAKPGIVYGNSLAVVAGYFFSGAHLFGTLVAVLAGSALVMASGCVFNAYIDRELDAQMERTKQRPLVTGEIPIPAALAFGTFLGAAGIALLAAFTNFLTAEIGMFGFFAYVVMYSIAKRRSVHGTLIGSISGAIPPVAGYAAATGVLDAQAVFLFVILVAWQLPHFYSIALYRKDDYMLAGVPVMPVIRGDAYTQSLTYASIAVLVIITLIGRALGYMGYTSTIALICVEVLWLQRGLVHRTRTPEKWGKVMFRFSLIVILALSAFLATAKLLP